MVLNNSLFNLHVQILLGLGRETPRAYSALGVGLQRISPSKNWKFDPTGFPAPHPDSWRGGEVVWPA